MARRKIDRNVVAMAAVLVAVVILIVAAVVASVSGVADAWVNPPEATEAERAASEQTDATQAATREALEKRLTLDDAWACAEEYGKQKYPAGFSFNSAGTIWETAVDDSTWDLRATCRVGEQDDVCRAIVKVGTSGEPYVDSFEIEDGFVDEALEDAGNQ